MRNYLDPVYLAITEEAWHDRIYSDIFVSLNTILEYLENIEGNTDTRYQLVKFKMTEALFAQIYSNNPFKNEPKIQAFYTRLFNDKILPELLQRRSEWCPNSGVISHQDIPCFQFKNHFVPDKVLTEWNNLLEHCLSCDSNDLLLYLLSPECHQTNIETESEFIKITHHIVQLLDITRFLSEDVISETRLRTAIEILYQQRIINDNWDSELKHQYYVFDDFFWQTIEREQLVDEDDEYKERFIGSMTQVVYDIDIDIRKHKYGKIAINGKNTLNTVQTFSKWGVAVMIEDAPEFSTVK
ncbi:hypothetical protein BGP_3976 [Beggiatoa sp. PS]|nr:hypothetical protein BGP_3976 [Beggiatoa sp. PS]